MSVDVTNTDVSASSSNDSSMAATAVPIDSSASADLSAQREKPATPWFIYFMVLLLALLVMLIILYCIALNDPDFPSHKHPGPNLAGITRPTLSSTIALLKPETGARALPHEIPFELHRPSPLEKPSKLVHPSSMRAGGGDKEAVASLQQQQQQQLPQGPQMTQMHPTNMERVTNVIRSIARQDILGLATSFLPKQAGPSSKVPQQMINGPYVSRLTKGATPSELIVEGAHFTTESEVRLLTDHYRTLDCQYVDSNHLRCANVESGAASGDTYRISVVNPDSQSCDFDPRDTNAYYISFAPPGIRALVHHNDVVRVGLYAAGVPETFPAQSVTICIDVLNRIDLSKVVSTTCAELVQGYASFQLDKMMIINPRREDTSQWVLRATATQVVVDPHTNNPKVIAPVIESYPFIVQ